MSRQKLGVFFAALIVALGGLVYELIIGATSSYLLGNSVLHFSLTIGFFLFGMGIGSFFSGYVEKDSHTKFVIIELLIALVGGFSVAILFSLYAFTNLIYVGLILLVLFIGALIGTEIPMLMQIVKQRSAGQQIKVTTQILSLDYLGALVASVLFPTILLPQLGLLVGSLFIGILNALVAALMMASFEDKIKHKRLLTGLTVFVITSLVLAILSSTSLTQLFSRGLYQDPVVYSQQSSYQNIVFTKFKDDLRMFLEGNIQFSSVDEYRYHEALIHYPIAIAPQIPQQVLILGGGDGLAARELLKYGQIERIDIVDLDPVVTKLAVEYQPLVDLNLGSLSNDKVSVTNQDAFEFLETSTNVYDMIVVDLPDPNNESLSKLYTVEFYHLAARHLNPSGVFVVQAVSPFFTPQTFWSIEATVAEAFSVTRPFRINVPSFGEWGFVAAGSKLNLASSDRLPQNLRLINGETALRQLEFFGDDMLAPNEPKVNSVFDSHIVLTYLDEVREFQ